MSSLNRDECAEPDGSFALVIGGDAQSLSPNPGVPQSFRGRVAPLTPPAESR